MKTHHKDDGGTKTTVYRTPSHTNQHLLWTSKHLITHKFSFVRTLYKWASIIKEDRQTYTTHWHTANIQHGPQSKEHGKSTARQAWRKQNKPQTENWKQQHHTPNSASSWFNQRTRSQHNIWNSCKIVETSERQWEDLTQEKLTQKGMWKGNNRTTHKITERKNRTCEPKVSQIRPLQKEKTRSWTGTT